MTAVLDYAAEAFVLSDDRVMGRQSAGASFLRGWAEHGSGNDFACYVAKASDAESFTQQIQQLKPGAGVRTARPDRLKAVVETGTLFCFHPELPQHAWRRRALGTNAYSLCGLTHTLSSHKVLDAVADMLVAPMREWDALICPSRAIRTVAETVLNDQQAYLSERMGARAIERPQLPVIPLGIRTGDFTPDPDKRQAGRKRFGLGDDEIAVIYVGRLSVHAKANPLPMFMALEQAAQSTGQKVRLLLVGWFANDKMADLFRTGAADLMPSVKMTIVKGTDTAERMASWAAADIFFQLSDNIQESFGLSPVEAMAAHLPAVVSDWDGFRDTIIKGETGFLAPSIQPPPGAGDELALRYDSGSLNYDFYIGATAQSTSISVQASAEALAELIRNPQLRQTMGEAGGKRARALYDWNAVIPQYEALWSELGERRKSAARAARALRPGRSDPFHMFAGFPTAVMTGTTTLALNPEATGQRSLKAFSTRQSARMVGDLILAEAGLETISDKLKSGEKTVAELITDIPPPARPIFLRSLGWLLKYNILLLK